MSNIVEQMALHRRIQYWTIMSFAFLAGVGFGVGANPWIGVGAFFSILAYSTIKAANG